MIPPFFDISIGLFETHAREKKIVLELEVEADVPDSLFGDVDRLRQIVTHLGLFPTLLFVFFSFSFVLFGVFTFHLFYNTVDNSIKFSKPPGRVAVHIELAREQPANQVRLKKKKKESKIEDLNLLFHYRIL